MAGTSYKRRQPAARQRVEHHPKGHPAYRGRAYRQSCIPASIPRSTDWLFHAGDAHKRGSGQEPGFLFREHASRRAGDRLMLSSCLPFSASAEGSAAREENKLKPRLPAPYNMLGESDNRRMPEEQPEPLPSSQVQGSCAASTDDTETSIPCHSRFFHGHASPKPDDHASPRRMPSGRPLSTACDPGRIPCCAAGRHRGPPVETGQEADSWREGAPQHASWRPRPRRVAETRVRVGALLPAGLGLMHLI